MLPLKPEALGSKIQQQLSWLQKQLLLCLQVCMIPSSMSCSDSLQTYSGRDVAIRALKVSEAAQLSVALCW